MKAPVQPFFRSMRIVLLTALLLLPAASHAQDSNAPEAPSWMEELAGAIRDWFQRFSSGDPGGDGASDSGSAPAADAGASGATSPPLSAAVTPTPDTEGATADPDALAQAIAREAGGHAQQYVDYSEKLAATLSQLTPAQRARVFHD